LKPNVKFNVGYTVWGQLTSQRRPSKLQDIHAVRTVLYIKRALEQFCKFYVFEFNDAQTWGQISSAIGPFLEYIKRARGLSSYGVSVGATKYELKIKTCHVDVMLEPTPIIEKIQLNLFIK
jgi:phage tail sheath protein FI